MIKYSSLFITFLLFTHSIKNINPIDSSNIEYNNKLDYDELKSSNKVVRNISKFFDFFYSFDISTRVSRVSSIYPFFWELDGSTTLRISFFKIFKKSKYLKHNFVFEVNFLKAKDLGGRGFDFLERKLGSNIKLNNWDEENKSKNFANGSYFFSILKKTAIFFSLGIEGNGFYNKLFKTEVFRSGFGIRIPLWCGGPFTLVKNLNLDYTNLKTITKEYKCQKWKNLNEKKPISGFLGNITLYIKPFIYEFDNGFRIDITWETCVNDYRYATYKIKKSKNKDGNISIFNIAKRSTKVNCFKKFLIVIENIFILKTKLEIGFNLAKLM